MAQEGQVIRLKRQGFGTWKQCQEKLLQSHLTEEELRQGAEVRLVRTTALDSIDQTKVRQIGEVVAEREGLVNRYAVLVCLPGTFKLRGGVKPNSGRKLGSGKGYGHKYQTKLPQDVYQQAVQLCMTKGGPENHTERIRYFILQGAITHQANHPGSRIDSGRGSGVLSAPENIWFTDEQVSALEKCRQPGETTYRLMQRLFQIGVQYCSSPQPAADG